jgi:hypothetical protein
LLLIKENLATAASHGKKKDVLKKSKEYNQYLYFILKRLQPMKMVLPRSSFSFSKASVVI